MHYAIKMQFAKNAKEGFYIVGHRQMGGIGLVALTAITWGLIRLGEELPSRMK
jgi:hypothetical protein